MSIYMAFKKKNVLLTYFARSPEIVNLSDEGESMKYQN